MRKTTTPTGKLAVTAQAPGQAWGQWPEQHPRPPVDSYYQSYGMDIPGLVRSYDSRAAVAATQAGLSRPIAAPQYAPPLPYTAAQNNNIISVSHPMVQPSYPPTTYADDGSQALGSFAPASYVPARPSPQYVRADLEPNRGVGYLRNPHSGYVKEPQPPQLHSPSAKPESMWMSNGNNGHVNINTNVHPSGNTATTNHSPIPESKTITPTLPIAGGPEVTFKTEVDTLMKTIQAKAQGTDSQSGPDERAKPVVSNSPSCVATLDDNLESRYIYQKLTLAIS